ncbi:MAG: hypothetical protein OHM56_11070 [Spiroplasma phoeniceum]|nr:MAG: hypothetical protein OHM57_10495 [Spiroplasma phoeniceum]UZQ32097.1 MAG: hypothetical protein OHM56_11070 [Spiroplasma phoeniceum]
MKKLLSLLSVLTISGSAIPTTIAASPYQKNNLETLNRKKRENNETLEQQKIVIRTDSNISYSGIVLNNKLYWGSDDHNVYEYDPATGEQKIVITTNYVVSSSGVVLNNKLYWGSFDDNRLLA